MTYKDFLKQDFDKTFYMRLSRKGEYILFSVRNEEDFNNVQNLNWNEVNFTIKVNYNGKVQ